MKLPTTKEKKVLLALLTFSFLLFLYSFITVFIAADFLFINYFIISLPLVFTLMVIGIAFLKAQQLFLKIIFFSLALSITAIEFFFSAGLCFFSCLSNIALIYGSLFLGFVLYLTVFIWVLFKKYNLRYVLVATITILYFIIMYHFVNLAIPTPFGPWYIGGKI